MKMLFAIYLATLCPLATLAQSNDYILLSAEAACGIVYCDNGSQGTGFFISTNGLFLTNYHVIEAAKSAYVKMRDGSKKRILFVANYSARPDLALLVVDAHPTNIFTIADPSDTQIGMKVYAIGGPHGLGWFRTEGIIEGIREFMGTEAIQHTAKIEPGNSGGPTFDTSGRVHAINTWLAPRKVLKSNGEYEVSWGDPQYLGVSSRVILRFLALPKYKYSLATLAAYNSNAEIAAFMLVACEFTDLIIRDLHSSIAEMDIVKDIYYDPSYRTVGGKYPAISKNYWLNADNFVASADECAQLKKFIFSQFDAKTSDRYLKEAIGQWTLCLDRINNAIDAIANSQGQSSRKMDAAVDKVIHEFTQANDAFYQTIRNSVAAYKTYRAYSTSSAPTDPQLIKELSVFYYNRGLTFTKR